MSRVESIKEDEENGELSMVGKFPVFLLYYYQRKALITRIIVHKQVKGAVKTPMTTKRISLMM